MNYVTPVSYSLLINGDQTCFFQPGRRLRQRDPLSPYLFIICTEGLIALLREAGLRGDIKGMTIGTGLDPLSHLFFANDTLHRSHHSGSHHVQMYS
ncbi:hypothetical protein LIER_16496 [Lithospermum erythrorhizon]|uniref:Uncharacterized protein n=1 Tax=Lithospermum erythrorhizon TaxID=34254 RepID=A0AAV3Q9D2_LITER